jgi:hypothetical protein
MTWHDLGGRFTGGHHSQLEKGQEEGLIFFFKEVMMSSDFRHFKMAV